MSGTDGVGNIRIFSLVILGFTLPTFPIEIIIIVVIIIFTVINILTLQMFKATAQFIYRLILAVEVSLFSQQLCA